jgi:LmbE family N-acetylglucosaminyl deacetylase
VPLALANPAQAPAYARVSLQSNQASATELVVVAHEDDWQLFMGDALTKRLRAGHRIVFVYLTAGDDGRDSAYWQTRERAALQSTKVAAGLSPQTIPKCGVVQIADHSIRKCDVLHASSYFFRLPDGRRNGHGFASNGYGSLRRFRVGKIATLRAIDASTTYHDWKDLAATVAAIVAGGSEIVTVHTTDPSILKNPHDHFDHRMSGLLVSELRGPRKWAVVYYAGYALASRAANRSAADVRVKTELFIAYDREMVAGNPAWSAYRERPKFYSSCMQRTYSRNLISTHLN